MLSTILKPEDQTKLSVQRLILFVSIVLFITKMGAYFLTSSVGILSDALESTINVFTGIMTYFSLKYSLKPRDMDHPYGHGKIELITASVEGILIAIAGFYIMYEAFLRFFYPSGMEHLSIGLILIGVCGLINYVVALYAVRIGRKHASMALVAGGQHLKTDTYTSIGLILGLLLVILTGLTWIDSVVAIVFGLIIWKGAYDILRNTTMGLMDQVDVSKLQGLVDTLAKEKKTKWIYAHKLTLLHFGHVTHLDMHLSLPYYFTLQHSLDEVINIKKVMETHFGDEEIEVSIQTDPCHPGLCHICNIDCPVRWHPFVEELDWDILTLTKGNIYKG
ncbi:MAG: cation diffusion facilitator family transporter [Saprospiraceae bacterium]